jgi:transposase
MPAPIPATRRAQIVAAYLSSHDSFKVVGEQFEVAEATVFRLVSRFLRTQSFSPDPPGGGLKPKIPDEDLPLLLRLREEHPSCSLARLAVLYAERGGSVVSSASIMRALKRSDSTAFSAERHAPAHVAAAGREFATPAEAAGVPDEAAVVMEIVAAARRAGRLTVRSPSSHLSQVHGR